MKNNLKIKTTTLLLFAFFINVKAQVAINTDESLPDASAILDISSNDKGILIPRLTETERDAISNPAAGLMVFNTTDSCFNYYTGMEWYKNCGRDLTTDETIYEGMTIGGTSSDAIEDIVIDSEDNIIIGGYFSENITLSDTTFTAVGSEDLYFAKFDSENKLIWAIHIGNTTKDNDPKVAIDDSDNIYIAGQFEGTLDIGGTSLTASNEDVFIAKYNSTGNQQWAVQGGFEEEVSLHEIDLDDDNNIYLGGHFTGTATINSSNLSSVEEDGFIIKSNNSGTWQWGIQTASNAKAFINDIHVNGDTIYCVGVIEEGITTIGDSTFTAIEENGFVAKYDINSTFIWAEDFYAEDDMTALIVTSDDNYNFYVGGYGYDDTTIGDTTLTGGDGEIYYVVKYNVSNQLEWVSHADDEQMVIRDLLLDKSGNLLATGSFTNTQNLKNYSLTSNGSHDLFALQYETTDGTINWIATGGGNSADYGNAIAVNANNLVYIVGDYKETATFSETTYTSEGFSDGLLLQINPEDGTQSIANNTLSNSQDGDTNSKNEIQDLSFNGTTLSISDGSSIDLSSITDDLGSHIASQNIALTNNWLSNDGDEEGIRIDNDGNVGIGKSASNAKFEVLGSGSNFASYTYGFLDSDGLTDTYTGTPNYSIYADGSIGAAQFHAHSDERIKNIQSISNSKEDLATLIKIEITNYTLKDSISTRNKSTKKVIAQQVKTVYPQAVSTNTTEVIPNIYQTATIDKNGWVKLTTNLQKDDKVQIIFKDKKELLEVIEIKENAFQVQPSTVHHKPSNVFVYGKQVDDFHTVDYQAISMLNVSATQQLAQKIEQLTIENEQLKAEVRKIKQLEKMFEQLAVKINNGMN